MSSLPEQKTMSGTGFRATFEARRGGVRGCRQRGVALVTSLVLLLAVLLIGISAARLALQGEKAARGERDRQLAFQAAEEALMDAENDIEGSAAAPGRSAMFAPDSALGTRSPTASSPAPSCRPGKDFCRSSGRAT